MESLAERKLRRKVVHYETKRLMRDKRSEEMESLEQVFDRSTLMIVYRLMNPRLHQKHQWRSPLWKGVPAILGCRQTKKASGDQDLLDYFSRILERQNDVHPRG